MESLDPSPDDFFQDIEEGEPYRPARDATAHSTITNPFYATFRQYLEFVLSHRESRDWTDDDFESLYTVRRLATPGMPSDAPQERTSRYAGRLEADILAWLQNDNNTKALTLTGLTGVGKTTLLHYVFKGPLSPALSRYVAVMVDVREVPNNASPHDIYLLLVAQLRTTLLSLCHNDPSEAWTREAAALHGEEHMTQAQLLTFLTERISGAVALLAANDRRLVVVLDNLDQNTPESVASVLALSRILCLRTGCRIIVAMRPPVYWTQTERYVDADGFVRRTMVVRPPDLALIIRARLKSALTSRQPGNPRSFVITAAGFLPVQVSRSQVVEMCDRILGYYLTERVQQAIVFDLCRFDLRKAFRVILAFLKNRRLALDGFLIRHLTGAPEPATPPPRAQKSKLMVFIDGVMHEDRSYYRERGSHTEDNMVMNVFDSSLKSVGRCNTWQYRLLSILLWEGGLVSIAQLRAAATRLGIEPESLLRSLQRLLQFGLIYSPDTECEARRIGNVRISSAGVFYVRTLLSHPDYLYAVICDTPLRHCGVTQAGGLFADDDEGGARTYDLRMPSIVELLKHLRDADREEVEVVDDLHITWYGNLIEASGFLSNRVFRLVCRLLEQGLTSRHAGVRTCAAWWQRVVLNHEVLNGTLLRTQYDERLDVCRPQRHKRRRIVTDVDLGEMGNARIQLTRDPMGDSCRLSVDWLPGNSDLAQRGLGAYVSLDHGRLLGGRAYVGFDVTSPEARILSDEIRQKRLGGQGHEVRVASEGEVSGHVVFTVQGEVISVASICDGLVAG
jgi:hypothetical protein